VCTSCCLYRVVPPDEQQACSQHVEFSYWNNLKVNGAFRWFLFYEFLECMTENNFLKRILLHNVRFSPSYLMMLLQLQNSILFKASGKRMCTSGEGKRREMKMVEKEKWKRRYKRRRENCSESKNDDKKCGRRKNSVYYLFVLLQLHNYWDSSVPMVWCRLATICC